MRTYLYLGGTIIKNRLKAFIKKPVSLFLALLAVAYVVFISFSFGGMFSDLGLNNRSGLIVTLSFLSLWATPTTMLQYAKRKGMLFMPGDTHFLFLAPTNPKLTLLYVGAKSLLMELALKLYICVVAVIYFQVEASAVIVYFVASLILDTMMLTAMTIIIYGNEALPAWVITALRYAIYAVLILLGLSMAYIFFYRGFNLMVIEYYLSFPVLKLLPIIGWELSLITVLFGQPTMVEYISVGIYVVAMLALFVYALKCRCTGEYFEDAATFAENYQKMKAAKKKGRSDLASMGVKQKFKKNVDFKFKGRYGKSLFYKQLLEYKKTRLGLISPTAIIFLLVSIGFVVLELYIVKEPIPVELRQFTIPGIMAYYFFVLSSVSGKWQLELENYYLYLIPDTTLRKLWYCTLADHLRAVIEAVALVAIVSFHWQLPILQVLGFIAMYLTLNAFSLYTKIFGETVVEKLLGKVGNMILRYSVYMIGVGLGIALLVICQIFLTYSIALAAVIIYGVIISILAFLLASIGFRKLEKIEAV
ncbi:MAG: putative ABC exporter domain-containing protein [Eubacteriales bacterium]|nr:putative ABC exporter domain-containing protein [Eubacteriales bacterium]